MPERIETAAQGIEGRPRIASPGPNLVESVDEECPSMPLGMRTRIESEEVTRRYKTRLVAERGTLGIERRALAGAGIAEKHVGRHAPECGEWSGNHPPLRLCCRARRSDRYVKLDIPISMTSVAL